MIYLVGGEYRNAFVTYEVNLRVLLVLVDACSAYISAIGDFQDLLWSISRIQRSAPLTDHSDEDSRSIARFIEVHTRHLEEAEGGDMC